MHRHDARIDQRGLFVVMEGPLVDPALDRKENYISRQHWNCKRSILESGRTRLQTERPYGNEAKGSS